MTVTADSCLLGGGADGGCGGDDKWPPGFRFHPTDEELVLYYLKRKMCKRRVRADPIRVLDVYKWDPEELPGQSLLKTGDRQWFFFSPRDRKYPNGARSNRATRQGYWKATGKDRNITCNSRSVGLKKTLVFYRGRAPHGERTDWVMHEYTLDEEELKRCPQVVDYYALYKIFKKSGPGPKNGEQYGAPFREEDWADEEDVVKINVNPEISVKQDDEVPCIDNAPVLGGVELSLDDVEAIFEQINDEPQNSDCVHVHHQAVGEETRSTLVNPSFLEMSYADTVEVLPVGAQQYEDRASFEVNKSANINLQFQDGPEVTSASKTSEQETPVWEGDFLEIEDLLNPQLNASDHERPVENILNAVQPTFTDADKFGENLSIDDLDGLGAFDLYHDAEMFLRDIGSFDDGAVSNQYVNSLGVDMVNQDGYQLQLHSLASQENFNYQLQPDSLASPENMNYQFQPTPMANQVDYQLPSGVNQVDNQFFVQSFDTDQVNNELLAQDNSSNHVALSGSVHASSNNPSGANGNQNSTEGGGAVSWVSSYLWNYVDSIPSSPAFASENPLVNKALGRMPSFSRLRTSVRSTDTIVGNAAANARRAGGNKGFILLSILGALCAMLWVLIGSVGVFGRSISL